MFIREAAIAASLTHPMKEQILFWVKSKVIVILKERSD